MASFWKKPLGTTGKKVEKAVQNVGKTIEKAVNDTGNYLSKDLGKDLLDGLNKTIEIGGIVYEYSIGAPAQLTKWVDDGLLNGNLDLYSGGLVSDWENSFEAPRKLGEKKNVESSIKSNVRVGAVAGATALTGGSVTAGLTMTALTPKASEATWEELFGGIAKGGGAVAGGVFGDLVNNIFNPADEVFNALNDDTGAVNIIENPNGNKKVLIVGLIVGVTLLTVAMATTKKRKK